MGVFDCASLDTSELLAKLHGDRPGCPASDVKVTVGALDRSDWSNHSGGSACEGLCHLTAGRGAPPFFGAEHAFFGAVAKVASDLQQRATGNTWKQRAGQCRGDDGRSTVTGSLA